MRSDRTSGEKDPLTQQAEVGATEHLPLEHLDPADCSSTGPEFQSVVSPAVTASQSLIRPVAKRLMPGRSASVASVIQSGRRAPLRAVSISANELISSMAEASSGQRSSTALRCSFSSSVRVAGCRVSQPVTYRIDGGGGAGVKPSRWGSSRRIQSRTREQWPRKPREVISR